jgi:nitroreductase
MSSTEPAAGVLEVIAQRWSPYRFAPRDVEAEKIGRCLDAARWAASSYNDQPWYFILVNRSHEAAFEEALGCLVEANRQWARHAGVLLFSAIRTSFARTGQPNRVALHDLGAAAAHFALQATAEGLQVHQMAGINLSQVRLTFKIPEGFEPQTAIAVGYADTGDADPDDPLAQRDAKPRRREAFEDFAFAGRWGEPAMHES